MGIYNKTNAITGVVKIKESAKSSAPPMPGRVEPESFTPALRFNADSTKSERRATTAIKAHSAPIIQTGVPLKLSFNK